MNDKSSPTGAAESVTWNFKLLAQNDLGGFGGMGEGMAVQIAKDFKEQPDKVTEVIYSFFTDKGYKMSKATFKKALSRVEVGPGFPKDLEGYLGHHAEVLKKAKKIKDIPNWKTALRPEFMEKARAQS